MVYSPYLTSWYSLQYPICIYKKRKRNDDQLSLGLGLGVMSIRIRIPRFLQLSYEYSHQDSTVLAVTTSSPQYIISRDDFKSTNCSVNLVNKLSFVIHFL